MKHCVFFILFIAITLPASEQPPFHTDGICFDDTSDDKSSTLLSQAKLALAFSEVVKEILSKDSKFVDCNRIYMAADTHLANFAERNIRQMAAISNTIDEEGKSHRYTKTVVINRERRALSKILSSNLDKETKIP